MVAVRFKLRFSNSPPASTRRLTTLSLDAQGHEHRGAGAGGGQFAPKGQGGAPTAVPVPAKRPHGERSADLHAQYQAMRQARIAAFNEIKADAEAAHDQARGHEAAIVKHVGNITPDEGDFGDAFNELDEINSQNVSDGRELFDRFKELEAAARAALKLHDDADLSVGKIVENGNALHAIIKECKAGRDRLRVYAEHRREMQAIRNGEAYESSRPTMLATHHAPAGYTKNRPLTFQGHKFVGGQFIPDDLVQAMPAAMRAKLERRSEGLFDEPHGPLGLEPEAQALAPVDQPDHPVAAALARAERYPDPHWNDAESHAAHAQGFASLPMGTPVVSLDDSTRGHLGKITKDDRGRNRVQLDGQAGFASNHVEPLDEKLSWRVLQHEASVQTERPVRVPVDELVQKREEEFATRPKPTENPVVKADVALADQIANEFAAGRNMTAAKLWNMADKAHGKTRAEGGYGPSDAYDSLEAGFNKSLAGKTDPRADLADAQRQANEIKEKINQLPTQTNRSGEKDTHQQFSTPPHYSYAVAWLANLSPTDVVMEPSAGSGCLAVQAANSGADVYANEYSPRRAEFLRNLFGDDRVHVEDAEQISAILPKKGVPAPTVVVMNPPFSQTAGRLGDKKDIMTGARHIEEALRLLAPGGRLVTIVGRGMGADTPTFRNWFQQMQGKYNLRANMEVGGDEYTKYGTHFGTRILIFDKTGPQQGEPVTGQAESIPDLMAKLAEVRNDRRATTEGKGVGTAGEPPGEPASARSPEGDGRGELWGGNDAAPAPVADVAGGPTGDGASGEAEPIRVEAGERQSIPGGELSGAGAGATGPGTEAEPTPAVAYTLRHPNEPKKPTGKGGGGRGKSKAKSGAGGASARGKSARGHLFPVPELRPASIVPVKALERGTEKEAVSPEHALFESWQPRTMSIEGAKKHTSPLAESAAMAAVRLPAPKQVLVLSPDLIEQKKVKDKLPDGRVIERELGLSEAGLEAVQYMAQAHEQFLPDSTNEEGETIKGHRRGMMSGDGTGTGKGRQIAAIMAHNLNQGRNKHVWVSLRDGLINDARRDLMDMGIDGSKIFDFKDLKGKSPPTDGIAFITYATLRAGPKDKTLPQNLDVLTSWLGKDFEGVVAFDEAHAMANSAGNVAGLEDELGFSHGDASQQAVAGMNLQRNLPRARVGYWTATGATEVDNLAYAERLGLWGPGTEFHNKVDFINEMNRGGVAAMEAVAQSLKATGGYNARTLSMNDGTPKGTVVTEKLEHHLQPHEIETYDAVADGWQNVLTQIDKVLASTGGKYNKNAKGAANSQFWGAQQRFFNQMLCSFQTRSVIEAMKKDITEGRAPVVQLVNTMEASTNRAIAGMKEGETYDDVDVSPAEILVNYLKQSFPIHRYEKYKDESGAIRSRLVRTQATAGPDGIPSLGLAPGQVIPKERVEFVKQMHPNEVIGGDPVEDPEAVAKRDELITGVANMRIPESPLDQLIKEFGPNRISEITGRKTRFVWVRDKHGNIVKERADRSPRDKQADIGRFQNGETQALVFSGAGNTGASYHADKLAKNQKQRVHYVLQPGWSAAPLVQSLGRTHRTNQVSAPIIRPVAIPQIPGNKRFLSSAARRLEQMGALTRGQKQAASGGLYGAEDNIESKEAQIAADQFFDDLKHRRIEGMNYEDVMHQLGFKTEEEDAQGNVRPKAHPDIPIRKFLNRLLAVKVDLQNRIFNEFSDRHVAAIKRADENGSLARGVEDFPGEKIHVDDEKVIYRDPTSGAEVKHVTATVHTKTDKVPWAEVDRRGTLVGFARNKVSGKLWAVYEGGNRMNEIGQIVKTYRLLSPGSVSYAPAETVGTLYHSPSQREAAKYAPVSTQDAKKEWEEQYAKLPDLTKSEQHFVTGALLPVWKRLGTGTPKIFRLKLDNGSKTVGRHIDPEFLDEFRNNFGIAAAAKEHKDEDVHAQLESGSAQARLSNGWRIVPVRAGHETRLEVKGWTSDKEMTPIADEFGLIKEKFNYKWRYFIPTGKDGVKVLARFTEKRPITQVEPLTTTMATTQFRSPSPSPSPHPRPRYRLVFPTRRW